MPNTAHYITGGCQLRNWLSNCITGCPDKLKLQYIACCATGQSHQNKQKEHLHCAGYVFCENSSLLSFGIK